MAETGPLLKYFSQEWLREQISKSLELHLCDIICISSLTLNSKVSKHS